MSKSPITITCFNPKNSQSFADSIIVPHGTTVGEFVDAHIGKTDMLVCLNRRPTTREAVLEDGDMVSLKVTKAVGA